MSFASLIASVRPLADEGFSVDLPDSWLQGRTAFGGLSAALALEAAKRFVADLPPLRSAQIAFVGPVGGKVEAKPRLLRQGRNAVWIGVELGGGKDVRLVATFVFMSALPVATRVAPPVPPTELLPVGEAALADSDLRPAFLRNHFETRYALPQKEKREADIWLWARLRERESLGTETELMLVGDALPPAVLPIMFKPGPVSSMTWQVNLLGVPSLENDDGWWLLRSQADEAASGTSSQQMMLWDSEGRCRATGTQTVAVFA